MNARLVEVTKRFGSMTAVDGVSFDIGSGEVVGLLGANGAGKTTSIRMLLGLEAPTSGRVELFGTSPDRQSVSRVGYVPQGLGLYTDLTARENMRFQAGVYGFEPGAPPPDLARWWEVIVARMPLGIRRRVAFEVALGHRPELLVLDEPTSGVSPLGRARLWDTIHATAEAGAGVLVTTHYLEEAEQCDRLVMLAAGRVVAAGGLGDVIGDGTTVTVATPDWARASDALRSAGIVATLTGGRLRVPAAGRDAVESVLAGTGAVVGVESSNLEETFVRLSR